MVTKVPWIIDMNNNTITDEENVATNGGWCSILGLAALTGVLIVIIISDNFHFQNDIFLLIFDSDKYTKFSVGLVWFGLSNAMPDASRRILVCSGSF